MRKVHLGERHLLESLGPRACETCRVPRRQCRTTTESPVAERSVNMKKHKSFSERHGYSAKDAPITVRMDAPRELREAIPQIAKQCGMSYSYMRDQVCGVLLVQPDPDNWSEIPNCRDEVNRHLRTCDWFQVYDIAEVLHRQMEDHSSKACFGDRLNQFFRKQGVGWELSHGDIRYRGSDSFEESSSRATKVLEGTGRPRAANEISEALKDISRRPDPDVTGAIHHCMAALEATARDVTGQPNPTLGQLASKLDLPRPLDKAIEKLWGYASERARHGKEDVALDASEAELLVHVAGALCTFLAIRKGS